jgi:septal ring-binding cell division protein DamX
VNDGKNAWQCQVATIGHVMLNDADSEKVDALSIDAGETDVESALGGILSSIEDLSASSAMSSVETWTAQLGAFSTRAVAEGVRDDFARRDIVVWLYPAENEYAAFTQVLFGRYVSRASAMAAVEELRKQHPELEYWLRRVPIAD